MIKGIKFTKYVYEDRRELDGEIQFDSFEDSESFLKYLKVYKSSWYGCMEEFCEDDNTLLLHTNFEYGEMQNKKDELKFLWVDYCN